MGASPIDIGQNGLERDDVCRIIRLADRLRDAARLTRRAGYGIMDSMSGFAA